MSMVICVVVGVAFGKMFSLIYFLFFIVCVFAHKLLPFFEFKPTICLLVGQHSANVLSTWNYAPVNCSCFCWYCCCCFTWLRLLVSSIIKCTTFLTLLKPHESLIIHCTFLGNTEHRVLSIEYECVMWVRKINHWQLHLKTNLTWIIIKLPWSF